MRGDKEVKKGPWKAEEDEVLMNHVNKYGPRDWSSIRSKGLLRRTGKSCRLRWVNKLQPNLKNGCKFSLEEERVVIELQRQFGNKWARIATYLPGRTDNDVKNFWSSRKKRLARLQTASSSNSRKQKGHHHSNNYSEEEKEDPFLPLSWQVGEEASSLVQVEQSSYLDQSSDGFLGAMDPSSSSCLTNYNHNVFEPNVMSMMNVECPAAEFPIQVPFDDPLMPVIPVPLSPESQELVARLENGGLMYELGPEDGASTTMMMMPSGNCCAVEDSNDLAAPDSFFFDDFPSDMFDNIEPLRSPCNWWNNGEQKTV